MALGHRLSFWLNTLHLHLTIFEPRARDHRSVGWSVHIVVPVYAKRLSKLNYCPWACDWCSRVYGLVSCLRNKWLVTLLYSMWENLGCSALVDWLIVFRLSVMISPPPIFALSLLSPNPETDIHRVFFEYFSDRAFLEFCLYFRRWFCRTPFAS